MRLRFDERRVGRCTRVAFSPTLPQDCPNIIRQEAQLRIPSSRLQAHSSMRNAVVVANLNEGSAHFTGAALIRTNRSADAMRAIRFMATISAPLPVA